MTRKDLLAIMSMLIYKDRFPICPPKWAVDKAEKLLAEVERRAGHKKGATLGASSYR